MLVTALSGGVGGAKLVLGLSKILKPGELTVIVNTGDDFKLFGLHISPDLDIVMYTLAGIVDEQKGWGIKTDTFNTLDALNGNYGLEKWFNLGDKDMATHLYRTSLLAQGHSLSDATATICSALGVKGIRILPMTDDTVQTMVKIPGGRTIHFQEYFVKRGCSDSVAGVSYSGSKTARPARGVLESLRKADKIIICPSNPIASIGPMLSIHGIYQALRKVNCPIIAVSPIVKGRPVKGPADKFMKGVKLDVSATGIAKYYKRFLDYLVMDESDAELSDEIRSIGLKAIVTNTVMRTLEEKVELARTLLRVGSEN